MRAFWPPQLDISPLRCYPFTTKLSCMWSVGAGSRMRYEANAITTGAGLNFEYNDRKNKIIPNEGLN